MITEKWSVANMSERKQIVIPQAYINKYGKENINLWSFSKISSFSDGCSWEYYLSRILKMKQKDNSYGILGTICHNLLEDFYNGKIKYDDMAKIFETKWLECELSGIKLCADETKNAKMMEDYKQDILTFFKNHKVTGKKLSESEIWIDLEHGGDVCIGYIDSILKEDGYYIIEDYKTSTIYKGQDILAHQRQLLLYALGLNQLGIPFEKIKIRWLFLKYSNIQFNHMIEVTYDETIKDSIKKKTTTCYKDEWVSKIKTQLKKDIVLYYKDTINNKAIKEMLDRCVQENSLDSLPVEIQDKYQIQDIVKTLRNHRWVKESTIQTQLKKDLKRNGVDDITTEIKLVECANKNSLSPVSELIDISNYHLSDAYVYGIINDDTIKELKESLCANIELIKANGKDEANWERETIIDESESFYCGVLCGQRNNCKYYDKYKKEKQMYTVEGCIGNELSGEELINELLNL